jgi:hypothetical protein
MLEKPQKRNDQDATQRFDDDGGAPLRLTIPKRKSGSAHPDGERHELRRLAHDLDVALAGVRAGELDALAKVDEAWRVFGARLALGPDPAVVHCPSCDATIMRDATLCGHCWTKLSPASATPTLR